MFCPTDVTIYLNNNEVPHWHRVNELDVTVFYVSIACGFSATIIAVLEPQLFTFRFSEQMSQDMCNVATQKTGALSVQSSMFRVRVVSGIRHWVLSSEP